MYSYSYLHAVNLHGMNNDEGRSPITLNIGSNHMYAALLTQQLIESDAATEWVESIATNAYADGLYYTLYIDLDDNTLLINADGNSTTRLQREDGSIRRVSSYHCPCGYEIEPYEELEAQLYMALYDEIHSAL